MIPLKCENPVFPFNGYWSFALVRLKLQSNFKGYSVRGKLPIAIFLRFPISPLRDTGALLLFAYSCFATIRDTPLWGSYG